MDLNTIETVTLPRSRGDIPDFRAGDAYLAGGTWLFSEPQENLRRLVDLTALGWRDLEWTGNGLTIAATCPLAALEAFACPPDWRATAVIRQCCLALLGSFKIRRMATVGGNLCLALPASPMAALAVAMDGLCTVWTQGGHERYVAAETLITGAHRTVLHDGDILRSLVLPVAALRRRAAFRRMSLTALGRSAALLIGTRDAAGIVLTVTASVAHPIRVAFAEPPARRTLHAAIEDAVPAWFDDAHGSPAWRRRITQGMAAEICDELMAA